MAERSISKLSLGRGLPRLRGGERLAALQAKQALLLGSAAEAYRDRIARQPTPQLRSKTVAVHCGKASGLDDDLQRKRFSRAPNALTQEAQPPRRRVPPGGDFWVSIGEFLHCSQYIENRRVPQPCPRGRDVGLLRVAL